RGADKLRFRPGPRTGRRSARGNRGRRPRALLDRALSLPGGAARYPREKPVGSTQKKEPPKLESSGGPVTLTLLIRAGACQSDRSATSRKRNAHSNRIQPTAFGQAAR